MAELNHSASCRCRVCGAPIEAFMSFGRMPIANGFLAASEIPSEYFFELAPAFCGHCGMFQIVEQPRPEKMFHAEYAFYSSTSRYMQLHFEKFALGVLEGVLKDRRDPFVVELGSNDGIMLRHFAAGGIRHLGVEPSANVAAAARARGVRTVSRFFDETAAREIRAEDGPADALLGANVMCHIPYIHSVFAGANTLLTPRGVLIFEDPYLGDIVEKTAYDQIYDEHAFYFSCASISALALRHELEVIDVLPQPVHGGSMRYVLARAGAYPVAEAVQRLRASEEALGLERPETYDRLRANVARSREELRALLLDLKRQGRRVVGYAATSKSTTVTNYCGITPDLVEFISDTTPLKQGKFSPGTHIPVRPHEDFAARYPDYALLFGWNHGEEIMAKERAFTGAGGKWIVYVPKVQVLG